jgi:hypothetical protein
MKKILIAAALLLVLSFTAEACPEGTYNLQGTWEGWKGNTVFTTMSGQHFVQTEYHYHYEYAYSPQVIFFNDSGICKALIGSSKPIAVRQLF